jgi:hypothetical protein
MKTGRRRTLCPFTFLLPRAKGKRNNVKRRHERQTPRSWPGTTDRRRTVTGRPRHFVLGRWSRWSNAAIQWLAAMT